MRTATILATVLGFFLITGFANAQQGDVGLGFGTILSNGSNACNATTCLVAEKGGFYPNINADVIFHKRLGFEFETAWKASQGAYGGTGGQPYRPIILDFNAIYQPRINKKAGLDLVAGIGWQSTRFYLPFCTNSFTCNNFTSTHHFVVDVGAGVRYYVWNHVFVRPEVRLYRINNNVEFSSDNIFRVGASIGYTIGPE
ncbi:MAG TPA: outer membrane beta-barrel protein [Candidatus Sulfotelmatobacter sp.]|nr:outer membrane beta-barrel protein [Candidatus Sulfotelmatobacter sp.]